MAGPASSGKASSLSPLAAPFKAGRFSSDIAESSPEQMPVHVLGGDFTAYPGQFSGDNWLHLQPPAPVSQPDLVQAIGYAYPASSSHAYSSYASASESVPSHDRLVEAGPFYPGYRLPVQGSSALSLSPNLSSFSYPVRSSRSWENFESEREDAGSTLRSQASKGSSLFPMLGDPIFQGCLSSEPLVQSKETPVDWQGKSVNPCPRKVQIRVKEGGPDGLDSKLSPLSEENSGPLHPSTVTTVLSSDSELQEMPYAHMLGSAKAVDSFGADTAFYDLYSVLNGSAMANAMVLESHNSFPALVSDPQIGGTNPCYEMVGTVISESATSGDHNVDLFRSKDDFQSLASGHLKGPCIHIMDVKQNSCSVDCSLNLPGNSSKGKLHMENIPIKQASIHSLASGTVFPGGSSETSPETCDHMNLAVDSPCWKGLSASCYSPFADTVPAASAPSLRKPVDDSLAVTFLVPPKLPVKKFVDGSEVGSSPKRFGSLVHQEDVNAQASSTSAAVPSSVACFLDSECNSSGVDVTASDYFQHRNQTVLHSFDQSEPLGNELSLSGSTLSNYHTKMSDEVPIIQGKAVPVSLPIECHVSDGYIAAKNVPNGSADNTSSETWQLAGSPGHVKNRDPKLNRQALIAVLHNMSEVLLSSHCCDSRALKEEDIQTLNHVIGNLKTFVSQKQVPALSLHMHEFDVTGNLSTSPEQGNICGKHATSSKKYDDDESTQHNNVDNLYDVDFQSRMNLREDIDMTQAINNALKDNNGYLEEKNSQVLLYKNLWIEAEAALCTMKYKLQLAQMKVEPEKTHCLFAKGSEDASMTPMPVDKVSISGARYCRSSAPTSMVHLTADNATPDYFLGQRNMKHNEMTYNMNHDVKDIEASALERFRILNSRTENLCLEKQESMRQVLNQVDSQDVPDSVMMPAEVGKLTSKTPVYGCAASYCFNGRADNQALDDCSKTKYVACKKKESWINNPEDVDASVLARFRILKSRRESSSSDCKSSTQQNPNSVSQVHNAGIPRCDSEANRFLMEHSYGESHDTVLLPSAARQHGIDRPRQSQGNMPLDTASLDPDEKPGSFCSKVSENAQAVDGKNIYSLQDLAATRDILDSGSNTVVDGSNRVRSHFLSSGSSSSASDWEHVLTEELAWKK